MGGGGRGMFAQHVPFDLEVFVPPFTFFFFPTFAPGEEKEGRKFSFLYTMLRNPCAHTHQYYTTLNSHTHTHRAADLKVIFYLSLLSALFQTCLPTSAHYFSFLCADSELGLFSKCWHFLKRHQNLWRTTLSMLLYSFPTCSTLSLVSLTFSWAHSLLCKSTKVQTENASVTILNVCTLHK